MTTTPALTWDEVRPRFQRMVLALSLRKVARKIGTPQFRPSKSALSLWFHGKVVPMRLARRAILAAVVCWEKERARSGTLKPARVVVQRWTPRGEPAGPTGRLAYR